MKKNKIFLALVLGVFLASSGFAGNFVNDGSSENMIWPDAYYDHYGNNTWTYSFEGGSEGQNGAYFQLTTGITTGGQLLNYGDIISVKAEHQQTKREFHLIPSKCTTWMGQNLQFWGLYLRPSEWMFNGTWKYILTYDHNNEIHRQTALKEMGTVTFPIQPSHIQINPSSEGFVVSWSGIGSPYGQNIDYRIRVFGDNNCGSEDFKGDWIGGSGTYDETLNKVIFILPSSLSHQSIRIENRINTGSQMSRSSRWTELPGDFQPNP